MSCNSPQKQFSDFDGVIQWHDVACGICKGCKQVQSNNARARKFYWARKFKYGG